MSKMEDVFLKERPSKQKKNCGGGVIIIIYFLSINKTKYCYIIDSLVWVNVWEGRQYLLGQTTMKINLYSKFILIY